jgi:hypothetical protein
MDEDQLESSDIPEICFITSADEHSSNGSSSGSSSGTGESDEDQDHDDDDDDDGSSQDQGTSDDSDDDLEPLSDDGVLKELGGRIDVPKRTRTGLAARPKKAALSTSPSNPSKIISATPTKKITKKSKKTVKSKGSKGSLSTAAARQATEEAKLEAAKPIVSRFLELENTKLNDKLLQVFMINGTSVLDDPMSALHGDDVAKIIFYCLFLLFVCLFVIVGVATIVGHIYGCRDGAVRD